MVVDNPIRVGVRTGRRWRGPVVLVLLLALLAGASWYAWQAVREEAPVARGARSCTPAAGTEPRDVQVRVLNATSTSGLGSRTAAQLRSRGFSITKVGNYEGYPFGGVAVIRGSRDSKVKMRLLNQQVRLAKLQYDAREGTGIDLIVGKRFTNLSPAPTKAPARC